MPPDAGSQRAWPNRVRSPKPYHILDSRTVPNEAPLATETMDSMGACSNHEDLIPTDTKLFCKIRPQDLKRILSCISQSPATVEAANIVGGDIAGWSGYPTNSPPTCDATTVIRSPAYCDALWGPGDFVRAGQQPLGRRGLDCRAAALRVVAEGFRPPMRGPLLHPPVTVGILIHHIFDGCYHGTATKIIDEAAAALEDKVPETQKGPAPGLEFQ
ncbi:hypothetical protein LA080_012764 [Diaporthe eres]|nr:hypothetical protein LA080_012764 [Diaporthe eres]